MLSLLSRETLLLFKSICRIDAGQIEAPVRFALVASVEMETTVRADIHLRVQEQLRVRARQRQQLRAQ